MSNSFWLLIKHEEDSAVPEELLNVNSGVTIELMKPCDGDKEWRIVYNHSLMRSPRTIAYFSEDSKAKRTFENINAGLNPIVV
jgi:hypothetical protein